MKTLVFNEARALAEVDADYSTTTELADTLQRVADVPFRVGHHFASELVNFGRGNNLKPAEIPYAEAQNDLCRGREVLQTRRCQAAADRSAVPHVAVTAQNMVDASQGLGGPQPAEVARMLAAEKAKLAQDRGWIDGGARQACRCVAQARRSVRAAAHGKVSDDDREFHTGLRRDRRRPDRAFRRAADDAAPAASPASPAFSPACCRPHGAIIRGALAFLAGLVVAPAIGGLGGYVIAAPAMPDSWVVIVVAGLLVGFGTRLGGGCTSGHGVCGIARLSPRSIVATLVFMAVAIAVVAIQRHVLGG